MLIINKHQPLEEIFSLATAFTSTDIMKKFKDVLKVLSENGRVAIVEKKKITAVIVDAKQYEEFLDQKELIEQLENIIAIEKAEKGKWYKQEVVDAIFEQANC